MYLFVVDEPPGDITGEKAAMAIAIEMEQQKNEKNSHCLSLGGASNLMPPNISSEYFVFTLPSLLFNV